MKIYFIGSHSTGKTSLARYVSNKYNLPFLNEVARTILVEKELQIDQLRTDLDLVDSYQNDIFFKQIEQEKDRKEFVSDRSFDCLAYAAQHSRIFHKLIRTPELISYIESLKNSDVKLFFIRPSKITMKNDGVRETVNWDGVVAIDAMIKLLLEMYNLNYFQISCDSMQERVKLIDSILNTSH